MKFDIIETLTDIDDEFIASAKPIAQKPVELRPEPRRPRPGVKRFAAAACLAAAAVALTVILNVRSGQGGHVQSPGDGGQSNKFSFYDELPLPDFSQVDPTYGLDIGKAVEGEDYVFEMEEFPGESFRVTYDGKILDKNGKAVIEAPNLFNAFLFDYNEDGKRDICVTAGYVGAYYVEVYDIENGRNRYSYTTYEYKVVGRDENGEDIIHRVCDLYYKPRYLGVAYGDKAYLMVATIEKDSSYYWVGSLDYHINIDEKPVIEESLLVCDCGRLSAGEEYGFTFNEYCSLSLYLKNTGNGTVLRYKERFFSGVRDFPVLEGVLNVYLYDSDHNGKREIWMTYLDGERSAVAVWIPDEEKVTYYSADDGNQRSLFLDNFELKIISEPSSGGEPVTEPLDLSKMTKRIISSTDTSFGGYNNDPGFSN